MFSNVIVGVDGRSGGRDAIALARQLVDEHGALTLARVFPGATMPTHAVTPGLVREDRELAERQLREDRAQAAVEADLVAAEGIAPGRVLHELAEERGADLLVLGSCHRSALGRAMLGDDTRQSMNGAPCAVAVAPRGYAAGAHPLAKIGVAYDGSPESRTALAAARALAARTGAQISALHVLQFPSYIYTGLIPPAGEAVDEMVRVADGEMKTLEGVAGSAEFGLPGDDLATFSRDVDLLVVGSRGYGPFGRLVHGSTSAYLQRHGRSPLLVLTRRAREQRDGEPAARSASRAPVHA